MARKFSEWSTWEKRNTLDGIQYPGIYSICISEEDISQEIFEWNSTSEIYKV